MAENDIMIELQTNLDKALKDFQQLEKQIKTTKASVDQELEPAVDNTSTKLQGLGGKLTGFGQKVKSSISGETALAFTALGAGVTSFTKQCVDSAISSESAWSRFGALVNQSGGNWEAQSKEIKTWASDFSSAMGYAVSDTREAATTFMQMGLNVDQTKNAMNAAAGVAARAGITESEAATVVSQALMGKGRQLQKLTGLRIDDYKTADGQIDQERLLNDLYNTNKDAIEAHGKTTEAQMNRLNNAFGKFKTGIGNALLPLVSALAGFVEAVVSGFNKMPAPMQTVIAVFLAVVAVVSSVIGVLGLIAPIIINVGTLLTSVGKWYGKLKLAKGVGESWTNFKGKINGVKTAISKLNLGNKVQSIKQAVLTSWTTLKTKITAAGRAIQNFELRQKLATIAQKAHTIATTVWNGVTKVATAVQAALNAVMNMNPIYLVVTAIVALIAVLGYLYFNNEQVRNTINALGDYLKGVFLPIWDGICNTLGAVVDWFKQVFDGSKSLTDALGDVVNVLMQFSPLGMIITILQGIGEAVAPAAQKIWDGFVNSLSGLGQWIWNTLSSIPQLVSEALSNLGGMVVEGGGLTEGILSIFAPLPMLIYGALQRLAPMVMPVIQQFVTDVINSFIGIGQGILDAFLNIPNMIIQSFNTIIMNIQAWFSQAGVTISMLIQGMVTNVTTQFWQLINNIGTIFSNIGLTVWNALMNVWQIAGQLANNIKTAITSRWDTLVGSASQIFGKVWNAVKTKLIEIVTGAKNKAKELVTNFVNKVKELPGKVGTEIWNLAITIKDKLVEAGKRAFEGAKHLVAQFLAGMGIHSPGYIQRATRQEMSTLPEIITDNANLAVNATTRMARGIVNAWDNNMSKLSIDEIGGLEQLTDLNTKINSITPEIKRNINSYDLTESLTQRSLTNPVQTAIMSMPLNRQETNHDTIPVTKNLIIENMNLGLGNLNEEQSKRVVFTALRDVYGAM